MADLSNEVAQEELSPEEIAQRKQELSNFYKDNIKHLKIQLEYETLLTDIEEQRAKRMQATMFLAQAFNKDTKENPEA
jgi:hypothetical protein